MPAIAYTIGQIITDAFIEIGACPPGENPSPEEQGWGLDKANDLIDIWQALEAYVYGYQFNVYTLVAGLSPHTIGPAASTPPPTFSTGEQPRPVRLESAALLLTESSPTTIVDIPMNIRDRTWWALQQVKNIETNIPTDVYYDPTFPIGSLYFWPVPNAAQQVRLQIWQAVSQFDEITDPIGGPGGPGTLPPAYRTALKLSLAELLCPGANREPSPVLVSAAAKARAAVFGNNAKSPRMQTQDAGMPGSGSRPGTRGDFNWFTGGQAGGPPE
jgi:hypothetical protein